MAENASQIVLRKLYAIKREQSTGAIEITSNTSESGSDFLQNPEPYIQKGNNTLEKKIFNSDDDSIIHEVTKLIDGNKKIIIIAYSTQSKLELYSYIEIENSKINDTESQNTKKEGCFIATACYGNYDAREVVVLRKFRDKHLLGNIIGCKLVSFYYCISPTLSTFLLHHKSLKQFVKNIFLKPIVNIIQNWG